MVPSPKVATYDLQPEMSAPELTDKVVAAINSGKYDLIVLNYANTDMVGHTGSLPAAIKAVETVDAALGRIAEAIERAGGALLVTADHGNCEMMRDPVTGEPHTAHTTNPVPLFLLGAQQPRAGDAGPPRRHRADLARTDGFAEAAGDDGHVAAARYVSRQAITSPDQVHHLFHGRGWACCRRPWPVQPAYRHPSARARVSDGGRRR